MNKKSSETSSKYISSLFLLLPMAFIFHAIETSYIDRAFHIALGITILYMVISSIISVKYKVPFILFIMILHILLSVLLAKLFIVPPNGSWFNPFGMDFTIGLSGIIIFIGILVGRWIAKMIIGSDIDE